MEIAELSVWNIRVPYSPSELVYIYYMVYRAIVTTYCLCKYTCIPERACHIHLPTQPKKKKTPISCLIMMIRRKEITALPISEHHMLHSSSYTFAFWAYSRMLLTTLS